jgi:hypothetical protein
LCKIISLDNKSLQSYTPTWDDDSINIEISTKTSLDAAGTYSLTFTAYNGVYNTSFTPATFTWNVIPNSNITLDSFAIVLNLKFFRSFIEIHSTIVSS